MSDLNLTIFLRKIEHCKSHCLFNENGNRLSLAQYEHHWNSKKHVPFNFHTENIVTENEESYYNCENEIFSSNEDIYSSNETFKFRPQNFSRANLNLFNSPTELNFYYWINTFGTFLPRTGLRSLIQLISDNSFHNFHIPCENRIKEIDNFISNEIFTLKKFRLDRRQITYLPIYEIIRGCLFNDNFRKNISISNRYISSDHYNYSDISIGDIFKSEKFKSIMNLKPIDEIFISLIIFSDDFAKQKRSKWCLVDALYIAFGNYPLKERFLHKNVFIFSAIQDSKFNISVELLVNSIKDFNNMNINYFFQEIGISLKI